MKKITFFSMLFVALVCTFNAHAQADLNGYNYYLIYLDDETLASIPAERIAQDYRPNGTTRNIDIWAAGETYIGVTATGLNYNGVGNGSYINFEVAAPAGWSGGGFSTAAGEPYDLTGITPNFTFHIALKSPAGDNASHLFYLNGLTGITAKVCIGSTPYIDGTETFQPVADYARDGEWHLIEIPMSTFFNLGLSYPTTTTANILSFLSGNAVGETIGMDAIYIYSKTPVGVNDVNADKLNVLVTEKTISVLGATAPIELYSITGSKIKVSNEAIMGIEDVTSGIYIVRCGGLAQKVQIK